MNSRIILTAAVTGALCMASCGGSAGKDEQVKDFTMNFAGKVKNGQIDSVKAMYPEVTDFDSIVAVFNPETMVVTPVESQEGWFEVKADSVVMTVSMDAEGNMKIESSKGLFAYSPDRMTAAKKYGQWKDGLTDAENSKRMNDTAFMAAVGKDFVEGVKKNLRAQGTGGVTDFGSLGVKVTNNNEFEIDGNDYTVAYTQTSYMRMMGQMSVANDYGSRPGATLAPKASKQYSVANPGAMAGNTVSSAKIKWKLSDDEIKAKYYKPTGNEYEEYLKSKLAK